jgi:hypothetical protein
MKNGGLALLLLMCCIANVKAQDDNPWRTSTSLETWGYGTFNDIRRGSLLNPDNRIAQIASDQVSLDVRLNLSIEHEAFDAILFPRLLEQTNWTEDASGASLFKHSSNSQLSQGFIRYKGRDDSWPTVVLGRELFSWGPANFRSPSNPFYFDSDRINPMAVTPGIDLLRSTWNWDTLRLTAAHVFSTNQISPPEDRGHSNLVKLDQQGSSYLLSLIVSQQHDTAPFWGGFIQCSPDDAWLLYGEFGSDRQAEVLRPNNTSADPLFTVSPPGARTHTVLFGMSYTLENGQALSSEYLHNTNGYGSNQEREYFNQIRTAGAIAKFNQTSGYAVLGQAFTLAPRLLGANYLWGNWQSNTQDGEKIWRVNWTQNLNDHSGQLQLFFEKPLVPTLSGFIAVTANKGHVDTEFGSLLGGSITLGLKWFGF